MIGALDWPLIMTQFRVPGSEERNDINTTG